MKRIVSIVVLSLVAEAANVPATSPPSAKAASLYCELRLKPKGQIMIQHPFPLPDLKDGQQVKLATDGIAAEVTVTFSNIDGYPSITIDRSDRRGVRTSSVDGSVEHSLTLSERDSKGNLSEVQCQLAPQNVER
jgi:hypothetical protein